MKPASVLPATPKAAVPFTWAIDLRALKGRFCRIENQDGAVREGRISGVRMLTTRINGKDYAVPDAIELNGDSEDKLEFGRMKELIIK